MPRISVPIRIITIVGLVEALAIAACSDANSPMSPNSRSTPASGPFAAQSACPSFDDACEEAGYALLDACPADGDYPNHGQFQKCRNQVLKDVVDAYSGCFTAEELTAIRDCAKAWQDAFVEEPEEPVDQQGEVDPPSKPAETYPRPYKV